MKQALSPIRTPHLIGLLACLSPLQSAWAQTSATTPTQYPPVQVIDTPLEYRQFEKIEITGSSILRKEQTQSLPVQVWTRQDIQRSGKQTLGEYLQSLPVMWNFFSPAMLGLVRSGFSGAGIHGLQSGTLVLINGRRLAGFGRQTSYGTDNGGIDLNSLPLSAIDRVEVLTDGASSIYGTDAQTGVVNIITHAERSGVELTVEHRSPDHQKGLSNRVGLSAGKGRLQRDGYSWYVAAEVHDQQELLGRDRPYASAGRYLLQQNGQDVWAYAPSLSVAQTTPTLSMASNGSGSRWWSANHQQGECLQEGVVAPDQEACFYNGYRDKGLYPASRAQRLHAQGQWRLGSGFTGYAELSWQKNAQTRSYDDWRTYSAKIGNTPDAPGYDMAVAQGFDPAQGVWLRYSGSDLGVSQRWYDLQTRRAVLGVKGAWEKWDVRSALYYSDNQASFANSGFAPYPNLGVDAQGVLTNPALLAPLSSPGAASAQLRQQLLGMYLPRIHVNEGIHRLQGLDLKMSRAVGEIDGRDVLLALGTDWRHEQANYDNFISTGLPSYRGSRSIWAQFAEVQIPLVPDIETIAALRNDVYSDFGRTTHGKLSAKWQPNAQWLLRGAWGTSFRAPAVAQMQEGSKAVVGRAIQDCMPELQWIADQLGGKCPADRGYRLYSSGSSELKPELSQQLNLGLRFSPSRNHSVSLDYWRVDMRDKINNPSSNVVMGDAIRYRQYFELNANQELQIYTPMVNMGQTQLAGVDIAWNYRQPIELGQLHMGMIGTWMLKSRHQAQEGEPFVSELNTYSFALGAIVPRVKTRWFLGLNQAANQWWLGINHVGGHDGGGVHALNLADGTSTDAQYRVPTWWTMDLAWVHQWNTQTTLRMGVENVFNRRAPMSFATQSSFNFGTDPALSNVWGRTVSVGMVHRF